jgi:hypothetical protein
MGVATGELKHFPEKLIDFSIKKMRQNNKLEKNCDSMESQFALGPGARCQNLQRLGMAGWAPDDNDGFQSDRYPAHVAKVRRIGLVRLNEPRERPAR